MRKVAKILAGAAVATSLLTSAAMAGNPIIGDYYEGVDSNAGRGELRSQTRIDAFATGSVNARSSAKKAAPIKGGEGEYYPGIQRN